MVVRHEFTELHKNENTLVMSMFCPNDNEKSCKIVKLTRNLNSPLVEKKLSAFFPKPKHMIKRASLRLISTEFPD